MSDNKRIAKNTAFLYLRQLIIMVVSIYTSRVILDVLGASDYGIYNVVGGIVTMMSFLNGALGSFKQMPLWSFYVEFKKLLRGNKELVLTEQQMEENATNWIKGWKHEFSISDFSQPLSLLNQDGIKDASACLNEMVVFCKERNITPVMVLPPMYYTLSDKFDKNARKVLIDDLLETLEDKSVKFLNYMDDSRFSHDITLFQDSFLLNKKGAKKFTKIVLADIGVI